MICTSQITIICICTDQSLLFKVPPTDKVCLWLGANVMLEYTLDDAEVLLKKNCEQVCYHVDVVNDGTSILYLCLEVF